MFAATLTALLISVAPLQAAPQQDPAAATPPVTATAPGPAADTRRVCRFETTTGSNRRVRVCRDVSRQGQQDASTREFMRDSQRVRMPDAQ